MSQKCQICDEVWALAKDDCNDHRCPDNVILEEEKERIRKIDVLLLIGLGKLFSDHSTRLIGEFKNGKVLHHFNRVVEDMDKWVNVIEKGLKDEHNQKTLEILITEMNQGLNKLRTELLTAE
jgi:tRNA 2-selenouridine synthase SelU